MGSMHLFAQTRVTYPAPIVVHEVPLWQMLAVYGAAFLLLTLFGLLIVVVLANLRRAREDVGK